MKIITAFSKILSTIKSSKSSSQPKVEVKVIEVQDNHRALRRVQYMHPDFIKPDGKPSSSSFTLKKNKDGSLEDGLSVDIEHLTTFEKSIQDIKRFRIFSLDVSFIRSLQLDCKHKPVEGNNAHGLIVGDIKKSTAKKLADKAVKISYPD